MQIIDKQEAQLPQRNSASAAHVYLGWLTDRAMHRTAAESQACRPLSAL